MKKLNKFFAVLVALAMMATLCVSMAFAVDGDEEPAAASNPNPNTATAAITISKELKIAQGLKAPENFTFKTTAVSVDGQESKKGEAPDLGSVTAETINLEDTDGDGVIIKNTTLSTKSIETLPEGSEKAYPHAGVYVYKLEEVVPTPANSNINYNTGNDSYFLTIRVDKDGKVTSVVIQKVKEDGTPATEKEKGTPGKDEDRVTGDTDDLPSDVLFKNLYKKVADETKDPNDPTNNDTHSFVITKAVTGDYSDTTKEFEFTLKVDTSKEKTNYEPSDVTLTVKKAGESTDITPDANGVYTFTLKHGETLTVDGAPAGSTYDVTENLGKDAASKKYKGTVAVTENEKTESLKATVTNSATEGANASATGALVGEKANATEFTNQNTKDEADPEGILISNLPYIALALVAVGGLVAYVVVRRKADDEA